MAHIKRFIDDQKLIDHIKETRGFEQGKTRDVSVEIVSQPPVTNSSISHVVKITASYGLKLDEVDELTKL